MLGPALSHQLPVPLCWWRPRERAASPTPPARVPAAPPRPQAVFVNRGQRLGAAGAGLGTGGLGGGGGGRGQPSGPRAGPGAEGAERSLSPPPAAATALTQGSSRLPGLGHCRHQKDVQMPPFCTVANKFLCDFFFPPRSCSPPNEPTGSQDGRARTPLRATPSASPTGLAARRRRGRAHPGQGREAGARSRPGPLPGVGSRGLNRLWALLLCGLELSATPAHAHAACLFLTSSPRPELSSPG